MMWMYLQRKRVRTMRIKRLHEKHKRRRPPRFELISGGAICLDFINTLDDRFSSEPKELLKDYVDLARFAEDTGTLSATFVDRLMEKSPLMREAAHEALQAAIQMREATYAVFWAIIHKKPLPAAALYKLNQYVQAAAQHVQLVPLNGRFEWRFDESLLNFQAPLWPIARSAAELLASDRLAYVRACESETCQWLFLDTSKNHRRRWCDMKQCGNRAKARRFYARQKEER